jgi:hypothetical protein
MANFTVVGTGGAEGFTVEYADEEPPTAASSWNELGYVNSATQNGVAAPEIRVDHLKSTEQETKVGFAGKGSYDVVCNFAPQAETNQVELASLAGGRQIHFRVTYPKGDSTSGTGALDTFIGQVQNVSRSIDKEGVATITYTLKYNESNPGLVVET